MSYKVLSLFNLNKNSTKSANINRRETKTSFGKAGIINFLLECTLRGKDKRIINSYNDLIVNYNDFEPGPVSNKEMSSIL